MGSLSPAQRGRYGEFLNTIPNELKGLSAVAMQKYLQDLDAKQNNLAKERAGYDTQIQNIKQAELKAKQAELEAKQMARPIQVSGNSVGQNSLGCYSDGDREILPFPIIIKKLYAQNAPLQSYIPFYRGYGMDKDPYRPFEYSPSRNPPGLYYLDNPEAVPNSVLEKFNKPREGMLGRWYGQWYPLSEDS